MNVKVTVLYPEDTYTDYYRPQRICTSVEVPGTIDDIRSDEPYEAILETLVRHWNRVDGSEIERHLDERECRSMSVGDVVQFGDRRHRTFVVDKVGFREIGN